MGVASTKDIAILLFLCGKRQNVGRHSKEKNEMDAGTTMGGQLNTRNDGSSSPFSQLMQEGYAESCEGEMETNLTGIFFCTKSLS